MCGCTGDPVESEVRTGVACGPVTAAGELVQVRNQDPLGGKLSEKRGDD